MVSLIEEEILWFFYIRVSDVIVYKLLSFYFMGCGIFVNKIIYLKSNIMFWRWGY